MHGNAGRQSPIPSGGPPAVPELTINRDLLTVIEQDALAAAPEEACGLLLGRIEDGHHIVERVLHSPNVLDGDRTRGYQVDPKIAFEALWAGRRSDTKMVGVYHSHPHGTTDPSHRDRAEAWVDRSYLIVAVADGAVSGMRSWRNSGVAGRFCREEILSPPAADSAPIGKAPRMTPRAGLI